LLPFAERFGIDYDLMFLIDHGHPVVALDHPMAGRHLGALGIGDIALALVTTGTDVLLAGFQKILNLFDLSLLCGHFLVVLLVHGTLLLCVFPVPVPCHALFPRRLVLLLLFAKLFMGPTPLLGGVRR